MQVELAAPGQLVEGEGLVWANIRQRNGGRSTPAPCWGTTLECWGPPCLGCV